MSMRSAQYVLLLLVRLNNSNRFQIYRATHCFSSRLFLHALDTAVGKLSGD